MGASWRPRFSPENEYAWIFDAGEVRWFGAVVIWAAIGIGIALIVTGSWWQGACLVVCAVLTMFNPLYHVLLKGELRKVRSYYGSALMLPLVLRRAAQRARRQAFSAYAILGWGTIAGIFILANSTTGAVVMLGFVVAEAAALAIDRIWGP